MIVLSYRRADSPGFARALRERLVRELGADRVFLDVETIEAGADFREGLRTAVSTAEALVVVIGPEWLGPPPAANRLHNDDDAVRLEIATALSAGVPVVPVLVDGATMPDADVLPDDVRALADRNAVVLGNERFEADVERLLDVLGAGAVRRTRRYLTVLVTSLVVLAVALVGTLVVQRMARAPFLLTVELKETGSGIPVSDGEVVLSAGEDSWTRPVDERGRAQFQAVPAALRDEPVTVSPRVPGFDTASSTHRVTSNLVQLWLRRAEGPSVTVRGVVLDANNRTLAGVLLDFDGGAAMATSDSAGNFSVTVPRRAGAVVPLRATHAGVVGYDDVVTLPASTLLVVTFDPGA